MAAAKRGPRSMARAFDEWMRRYKKNPEHFGNEMQAIKAHGERAKGGTAYGRDCAVYLSALMSGEI